MALKGIAERTFERSFQLDDHVVVKGARLENGLCTCTSYAKFRPAPDVVTGGIWECPGFPGCFRLATKVRGSAGRRSQDQSPPCTVGTI
jgi:hypothetical protein